jgi:hypothetical protein
MKSNNISLQFEGANGARYPINIDRDNSTGQIKVTKEKLQNSNPTNLAFFTKGGLKTLNFDLTIDPTFEGYDRFDLLNKYKEVGMMVYEVSQDGDSNKNKLWLLKYMPDQVRQGFSYVYHSEDEQWVEIPTIAGYRIINDRFSSEQLPLLNKELGMLVYDTNPNNYNLDPRKNLWLLNKLADPVIASEDKWIRLYNDPDYFIVENKDNLPSTIEKRVGMLVYEPKNADDPRKNLWILTKKGDPSATKEDDKKDSWKQLIFNSQITISQNEVTETFNLDQHEPVIINLPDIPELNYKIVNELKESDLTADDLNRIFYDVSITGEDYKKHLFIIEKDGDNYKKVQLIPDPQTIPEPENSTITITQGDVSESFTLNQSGNKMITLPNIPTVSDSAITITQDDYSWEFTLNQATGDIITLPGAAYLIVDDKNNLPETIIKKVGMIVYDKKAKDVKNYNDHLFILTKIGDPDTGTPDEWTQLIKDFPDFPEIPELNYKIVEDLPKNLTKDDLGVIYYNKGITDNDYKKHLFIVEEYKDDNDEIAYRLAQLIPESQDIGKKTIIIRQDNKNIGLFGLNEAGVDDKIIDLPNSTYHIVNYQQDLPEITKKDDKYDETYFGHLAFVKYKGDMAEHTLIQKTYICKYENNNLQWAEFKTEQGIVQTSNITIGNYVNNNKTWPAIFDNNDPILLFEGAIDSKNKKQIELELEQDSGNPHKLIIKISDEFILEEHGI